MREDYSLISRRWAIVVRRRLELKPGRSPGLVVSSYAGFTMTELIVVIVIVGILVAVALPRWVGDTGFENRGLRDETAASLRYAQKSAIASRRQVCLAFTANGMTATVATAFAGPCSVDLPGPSGGQLQVAARGGATYSTQPGAALTFDPQGRPTGRTVITVQGLPSVLDLVVEAETGYVH